MRREWLEWRPNPLFIFILPNFLCFHIHIPWRADTEIKLADFGHKEINVTVLLNVIVKYSVVLLNIIIKVFIKGWAGVVWLIVIVTGFYSCAFEGAGRVLANNLQFGVNGGGRKTGILYVAWCGCGTLAVARNAGENGGFIFVSAVFG